MARRHACCTGVFLRSGRDQRQGTPGTERACKSPAEDKKVWPLREEARRRPGYEASLRLGEAAAAVLESRAAEVSRRVLRGLTPMARAVAAGPDVQGCVFNVSFLVNRGASDDFRSAGGAIRKRALRTRRAASCGPAVLLQLRRRCRHSRAGRRRLTWD
ncbi:GvpL/GvpF family gas vesicle protein [Streptomyces yanii]|uniref:GvpL/GvpF family gas vesicle protein n=1 Tax=Streptomyces yanii TaxID=78510 RepID=A0ABV5RSA4_9ACTN